jgi:hypothetical protein
MTFLYKWLGIPRTPEEFLERVKAEGKKTAEINLWEKRGSAGNERPYSYYHHFQVRLDSEGTKMRLPKHYYGHLVIYSKRILKNLITERETERDSLQEMLENAAKLEEQGIEPRFLRKGNEIDIYAELEKCETEINRYEAHKENGFFALEDVEEIEKLDREVLLAEGELRSALGTAIKRMKSQVLERKLETNLDEAVKRSRETGKRYPVDE